MDFSTRLFLWFRIIPCVDLIVLCVCGVWLSVVLYHDTKKDFRDHPEILALLEMFLRDEGCERLMKRNVDWVVFFTFMIFNSKQTATHSKMGVAVRDFNFFTGTILQLRLERMKGLFEGHLFEVLLLGFFGCWLFIMNRMKPA